MKSKNYPFIAFIFLLCPVFCVETVSAETQTLGLRQAIAEAMEKNPQLRQTEAAVMEASWKPLEALSGNLPQIQFTASHLFDVKFQTLDFSVAGQSSVFPLVQPETQANFDISWRVFDGFKGINNYRAAKLYSEASQYNLASTKFVLEEEVRYKFFNALGTQALQAVAEQNVVTLKDHLTKTQEILRRGSATKFDLLRVEVQLEEAQSEKLAADDAAAVARKALSVAMGMEQDDARTLTGELPAPDEKLIEDPFTNEFSARSDIAAAQRRADAASLQHSASIGSWIPSVTFAAEKTFYNNVTTDIYSQYRDAYFFAVNVTWNVFDGGASLSRFKQTAYQAEQAQAALDAIRLSAPEDLETWKRRFYYNVELYRAKRRAVETAQESVRLANLGYGAGTRTSTDVLDAELDLFRAKAGVVRAQLNGIEAAGRLEVALGKKIFRLQK